MGKPYDDSLTHRRYKQRRDRALTMLGKIHREEYLELMELLKQWEDEAEQQNAPRP
jgi:hypothetical protein